MRPPWAASSASFKQQFKAHVWGKNVTERYPGVRPFATIRKTKYLKHHGEEVTLLVTHIKSSLVLQFHCFDIVNLLQYINHSAFSFANIFIKYCYSSMLYLPEYNRNRNKVLREGSSLLATTENTLVTWLVSIRTSPYGVLLGSSNISIVSALKHTFSRYYHRAKPGA